MIKKKLKLCTATDLWYIKFIYSKRKIAPTFCGLLRKPELGKIFVNQNFKLHNGARHTNHYAKIMIYMYTRCTFCRQATDNKVVREKGTNFPKEKKSISCSDKNLFLFTSICHICTTISRILIFVESFSFANQLRWHCPWVDIIFSRILLPLDQNLHSFFLQIAGGWQDSINIHNYGQSSTRCLTRYLLTY